ncbi:MAG: RNA pseudouridine synthase [Paracoccaceae bacterium]|nr:MAG: RNA pseudouridine synthase [Paracoccaceae bacterium]
MTYRYAPPPGDPVIIHADDHVLVVDKPEGLLSVPGKGPDKADCLIARLMRAYPRVLLVHRLDTDTSGVMVFARTSAAQVALAGQFERRETAKVYVARVWGDVAGEGGTIDLPLIVDWPNRPRQHVNHETGRPAVTDWRVIGRAPGETRLELRPRTGRSHQLRVHCLELGHPILGDPLYARGAAADQPRLMLHAARLGFAHPATGAAVVFDSPVPF